MFIENRDERRGKKDALSKIEECQRFAGTPIKN
jgi:hypothetical protein